MSDTVANADVQTPRVDGPWMHLVGKGTTKHPDVNAEYVKEELQSTKDELDMQQQGIFTETLRRDDDMQMNVVRLPAPNPVDALPSQFEPDVVKGTSGAAQ